MLHLGNAQAHKYSLIIWAKKKKFILSHFEQRLETPETGGIIVIIASLILVSSVLLLVLVLIDFSVHHGLIDCHIICKQDTQGSVIFKLFMAYLNKSIFQQCH